MKPRPEKDLGNLASASMKQMLVRLGPPQLLWAKPVPITGPCFEVTHRVLAFTTQGMPIQALPVPYTCLGLYPNPTCH